MINTFGPVDFMSALAEVSTSSDVCCLGPCPAAFAGGRRVSLCQREGHCCVKSRGHTLMSTLPQSCDRTAVAIDALQECGQYLGDVLDGEVPIAPRTVADELGDLQSNA